MEKKLKLKPLFTGVLLILFLVSMMVDKFNSDLHKFGASKATLYDGYFGYVIIFIFMIVGFSILSYGLGLKLKISEFGQVMYDGVIKLFTNKLGKK